MDNETTSWSHYSHWKNSDRFQTHGQGAGAALAWDATAREPWKSVTPASAAAALVSMYGPTRAADHAEAMKAEHADHSPAAVFYDQVARAIERGIVAAKAGG